VGESKQEFSNDGSVSSLIDAGLGAALIQQVVRERNLRDFSEVKENLSYWLSKTPEEHVGAVECLKRALHGSSARLQRSARVIQRSPSAPRSKERSNELVLNKQASGRKKDQTDLEALGVE